jgi:hypothetical protein
MIIGQKNWIAQIRSYICSAISLLVFIPSVAQSQNIFKVPYFNSTDAETGLFTWSWPTNDGRFSRLRLTVSGQRADGTKESIEVWNQTLLDVRSVTYNLNLDSTYFKSGTPLIVKSEVIAKDGRTFDQTVRGFVKNRSMTMFHPHVEIVSDNLSENNATLFDSRDITNRFILAGYNTLYSNIQNTNETSFLARLPIYNALHIHTHGNTSLFITPENSNTASALTGWITAEKIIAAVAKKNQYMPPYNFFFSEACHLMGEKVSESSAFADAFGISNDSRNRFVIGFRNFVHISPHNDAWVMRIYTNLDREMTVSEAIDQANLYGLPTGSPEPTPGGDYEFFADFLFGGLKSTQITPVKYGDNKMKLHGLYKTSNTNVSWAYVETTTQ